MKVGKTSSLLRLDYKVPSPYIFTLIMDVLKPDIAHPATRDMLFANDIVQIDTTRERVERKPREMEKRNGGQRSYDWSKENGV